MSFEDAVAAVEGAIAEEAAAEAATPSLFAEPAPAPTDQAATPSAPQGESAPTGAAPNAAETPAEPAAPVDTFDDGVFNPDTLPAELKPAWNQLQAAWTKKTQGLAEQRKAFESLGSVEELQSAHTLYQQLQDPNNWAQIHSELAQLMEQRGMSPATPQPAAAPAPNAALDELNDYPELAPIAQQMQAMQAQIAAMQNGFAQEREAFRREQAEAAVAGEYARQEAVLVAAGKTPEQMENITKVAAAFEGNLIAASQFIDAQVQAGLKSYVDSKSQAQRTPVAPIAGGAAGSVVPAQPRSLEEATEIAMERLKAAGLDTLDI